MAFKRGNLGGHKIRELCCFNSVHFSCQLFFFPPQPDLKRFGTGPTPIKAVNVASFAACLCPGRVQGEFRLHCAGLGLRSAQLRGPREAKKNPHSNTTRTRLFLNRQRPSPPPVHKSQHDVYTTKVLLRFLFLSKYFGTKSECFLGTARFRQAVHNDIFRDRPWLSKMQCL